MANLPLARSIVGRSGVPALSRVDPEIFLRRTLAACMDCAFCRDSCCSFGADVDSPTVDRLLGACAADLESRVGVRRDLWFARRWTVDPEFVGGRNTRTVVREGRCVFLRRPERGCHIHALCLERGLDYHELKPMVCSLFPLTFDQGVLRPSAEVVDGSLACLNEGLPMYQVAREELRYYFGAPLVAELDRLERQVLLTHAGLQVVEAAGLGLQGRP